MDVAQHTFRYSLLSHKVKSHFSIYTSISNIVNFGFPSEKL